MTETTHRKFSQLEELLSKLHDGVASDEEKRIIEDLLSGDPEACEFYLDYTELCAQMEFELGASTPLEIGNNAISAQISESTALFYRGKRPNKSFHKIGNPLQYLLLLPYLYFLLAQY